MVNHRISSIAACDRVMVLSSGRIEAFDTWANLMAVSKSFVELAGSEEQA